MISLFTSLLGISKKSHSPYISIVYIHAVFLQYGNVGIMSRSSLPSPLELPFNIQAIAYKYRVSFRAMPPGHIISSQPIKA
jgi:hypothetical protein